MGSFPGSLLQPAGLTKTGRPLASQQGWEGASRAWGPPAAHSSWPWAPPGPTRSRQRLEGRSRGARWAGSWRPAGGRWPGPPGTTRSKAQVSRAQGRPAAGLRARGGDGGGARTAASASQLAGRRREPAAGDRHTQRPISTRLGAGAGLSLRLVPD